MSSALLPLVLLIIVLAALLVVLIFVLASFSRLLSLLLLRLVHPTEDLFDLHDLVDRDGLVHGLGLARTLALFVQTLAHRLLSKAISMFFHLWYCHHVLDEPQLHQRKHNAVDPRVQPHLRQLPLHGSHRRAWHDDRGQKMCSQSEAALGMLKAFAVGLS